MDKVYFEELKGYFNSFRALPEHNIQELFDELETKFAEPVEPINLEPVVAKPKKVKTPNKVTQEAIEELENGKGQRAANVDELMKDLNAD